MRHIELYLGLGSNQGDRRAMIESALRLLDAGLGLSCAELSTFYDNPSWGFSGADFLNAVARYDLPFAGQSAYVYAHRVLSVCKEIETVLGRPPQPWTKGGDRLYSDRCIDIDLLFLGNEEIDSPVLTVPHPLAYQRDFVKIPLREVATEDFKAAYPEIFA